MGPVDRYNTSVKHGSHSPSYNAALYEENEHHPSHHHRAAPTRHPANHLINVIAGQEGRAIDGHHLSSSLLQVPHDQSCSSSSSSTDLDVSIVSEMYNKSSNMNATVTRSRTVSVSPGIYNNSLNNSLTGVDGSSSGGEVGVGRDTGRSSANRSTSSPRSSPLNNPMGSPNNNLRSTPRSSPLPCPMPSPLPSPMRSPMCSPKNNLRSTPRSSPLPSPMCSPRNNLRSTPRSSPLNSPVSSPRNSPVKALRSTSVQQTVSVSEEGVQEVETIVSEPLQTTRLKPIRQRTKNAVISILDDGYVCLELIKQKDGADRVVEVLKIAPNGEKVEVYQPAKGCLLGDQPPTPCTHTPTRVYPLHDLPHKYWKRYQYTTRFVWLIRSKTPKVTMYTRLAKCMLMENAPNADCEVIFYDGSRYSYACRESRLHLSDGTMFVLEDAAAWLHLSPATRRACQYAQESHRRCIELESLLTPLDQRNTDVIYFPVMVGRRPNMFSITATSGSEGEKTPTKGVQQRQYEDRVSSPCSSRNSTPEKTICPSPSSGRSQSPTTTLDNTIVNQFSTPITSLLARQGARRRSRSVDPSVQLHMTETYNDATKRQRHASGSVSPRSRPAWEQARREAWEISDIAASPVMMSPVMTSSPSQPDVMSSVLVPGVGRGTLLSNGEVLMEFTDLSALSIQSSPCMVVRYRDVDGFTALYEETDQLPTDVKHKLEALPYVMSNLEAVQAKMPQRQMTP